MLLTDRVAIVSGIGCTGRVAGYVKLDSFHTTHGRAIPFATGLKLANPKLNVVVYSGDGDLSAIGGNHLIHAARRNIDLKGGQQTDAKTSANLPGLDASSRFSTTNRRNRGSAPHDEIRDNLEGIRFEPPPEWRGKFEGYKNKLAKVVAPKAAPKASVTTGGQK